MVEVAEFRGIAFVLTMMLLAAGISGCGRSQVDPAVGTTGLATGSHTYVSNSLKFVIPEDVRNILKRKCYACHGNHEPEGGFDFRQMTYRPQDESDWQPMDLAAATRLKLAILPVDGMPPRMPKKAGSIFNPLTQEEANLIAGWTDFPYQR